MGDEGSLGVFFEELMHFQDAIRFETMPGYWVRQARIYTVPTGVINDLLQLERTQYVLWGAPVHAFWAESASIAAEVIARPRWIKYFT